MNPALIIREAIEAGVDLSLTDVGTIKVSGDQATVDRLKPIIGQHKAAIIEELKAANEVMRSCWWRIHFEAGDVAIYHRRPLTEAEARDAYRAAIRVEPFKPKPAPPLPAKDEAAIRAWLGAIGETDRSTIEDTLTQCRFDAEARAYYLRQAAETRTERSK